MSSTWEVRARHAEQKLRMIQKLVNTYSLYGMVPCDELDDVLDSESGGYENG